MNKSLAFLLTIFAITTADGRAANRTWRRLGSAIALAMVTLSYRAGRPLDQSQRSS